MHRPTPPPSPLDAFITRDHAVLRILDELVLWLRNYRSAAISGESGVGKSLAAYLVHRVVGPPGVPPVVRDAADVAHPWATPSEDVTLVLDHLDRWPIPQQLALLESLGDQPRPRVLVLSRVASSRLVAEGRLLPELAAWWADREAELPPLRARPDDLVRLVGTYLRHKGRSDVEVEPAAWRALSEHGWPDNVRELESVLDEALERVPGDRLGHAHLALDPLAPPSLHALADGEFEQVRRTVDAWYLRRLLHHTRGNISEAARRSGCSRKVLRDRLRRHGLYAARLAELDDDGPSAAEPMGPGWGARPREEPSDRHHGHAEPDDDPGEHTEHHRIAEPQPMGAGGPSPGSWRTAAAAIPSTPEHHGPWRHRARGPACMPGPTRTATR